MSLKPTLLLILDGWGKAPAGPGNAVTLAGMPHLSSLLRQAGGTELACSGRAVGLPEGFMGNSEVGHMNIGAGRVVYQDMTRIDIAVERGELASNPALTGLFEAVRATGGRVHLMGLLSDGGVHSHIAHVEALALAARDAGVEVVVHAFLDGRDTAPTSGVGYVKRLASFLESNRAGRIGSLVGRYYAMDRDKRWDRNLLAWAMLTRGEGAPADDPVGAVEAAYAAGETDEFVKPRVVVEGGSAIGTIRDGDGVFFFNFRADRARQLSHMFVDGTFEHGDRGHVPSLAGFATMTSYDPALGLPVAFDKQPLDGTLGEVVANQGLRQLRIAETEKYAHVTYFLNCGREEPFPGEERRLLPSPRDVATYDLKPEMSAEAVTDTLLEEWAGGGYTLAVCNLANLDMVGHTGVIPAAVRACETVDACVGRIADAVLASGGRLVITADHGNAEELLDESGNPQTAHSMNRVPFTVVEQGRVHTFREGGVLGDIAPTILGLWGVPASAGMTGTSLITE
ncbi:MAG TPA: 2,3-bisphosphoglycerate-independent phosphoglycerate mutase [Desulfovibrio sp.]|nr:2,3-bisphosphoglycerate-independent phosphoglycerate mutase [Desulfovibrio sp.]